MTREEINAAEIEAGVTRIYYHDNPEVFEEYGKWCYLFHVLGAILDEEVDRIPTAA